MEIEKFKESDGVYCLGDSTGYSCDFEFVWLIYDYASDYYEGSGDAIAMSKDGKLYHTNLGHCSCYGPFEGSWDEVTLDLITSDTIHDLGVSSNLADAVLELMGK